MVTQRTYQDPEEYDIVPYDDYPEGQEQIVICRDSRVPDDPKAPPSPFKYIQLVQPRSKVCKRGEAPEGTFYCKDVGYAESLEIEPTGFYLQQKYAIWNPANETFVTYCQAIGTNLTQMVGKGTPGGKCLDCELRFWSEEVIKGTQDTKRVRPYCNGLTRYEVFVREWGINAFWETDKQTLVRSINNLVDNRGWGNFVLKIFPRAIPREENRVIYETGYAIMLQAKPLYGAKIVEAEGRLVESPAQAPQQLPPQAKSLPPHLQERNGHPESEAAAALDNMPPHLRDRQQQATAPAPRVVRQQPAAAPAQRQAFRPGQDVPPHLQGAHLIQDEENYDAQDPFDDDLPF